MWTQLSPLARAPRATAACAGLMLAVALPTTAAFASASRATPSKGIGYVDETQGGHIALTMARDARQVTRAHVGYTYTCNDGSTFTDFEAFRSIPLSRTGTFRSSYDSGDFPTPLLPGVTSRFTGTIDGRRNRLRTRVTGSFRFTAVTTIVSTGEVLTCDTGRVRYTAKD